MRYVAAFAWFLFAAAAQADEAMRYEDCMTLARTDPQKGVEAAVAWRKSRGGQPADHCLATALIARGDKEEGAQLLQEIASEDGRPEMRAKLYAQAGQAWLAVGEVRRAWSALSDGLALDPESTDLLVDRAVANAELGLVFEAIDDLNRALDLAPGRVDALVLRASAWRRMGNLDLAEDDANRAVAAQPRNVDALLERGNLHLLRGRSAQAREDWIAVLRLDPEGPAGEAARKNVEKMDVQKPR
jgi:tetratricopeptide (TPR) repeat protein